MCATCGCDAEDAVKLLMPGETANHHHHDHDHDHDHHHHDHDHNHHHHDHHHDHRVIDLEKDVLLKNSLMAERNRGFLEAKNIMA
ncbi:MAG: hypothetical protein P8X57_05405, partial [Cyclobacteriaceae bacterium]